MSVAEGKVTLEPREGSTYRWAGSAVLPSYGNGEFSSPRSEHRNRNKSAVYGGEHGGTQANVGIRLVNGKKAMRGGAQRLETQLPPAQLPPVGPTERQNHAFLPWRNAVRVAIGTGTAESGEGALTWGRCGVNRAILCRAGVAVIAL